MKLRPYQQDAVNAIWAHISDRKDNPCAVLPTGSGKTPILAQLCSDVVNRWNRRVLVLSHVKELLAQAVDKIKIMSPQLPVGIYSAGLGFKETGYAVTVAGIQSIHRKADKLGVIDLVIVDECHLIPKSGDGMYLRLLKDLRLINPAMRVVGLTATPYRTKGGVICGEDAILNSICYECGVRELIAKGYLCDVRTKGSKKKVDLKGVHTRGGEFVQGELEAIMNDEVLVSIAVQEIIEETRDRTSVLIFATGKKHAGQIRAEIEKHGHECGYVDGESLDFGRSHTLTRFQQRDLKFLVNINVLTTGFDAPNIDCVVMMRPTMSAGLYYQMVGRGFRIDPHKDDCLVLDYGGNVLRHGPVDAITVKSVGSGGGDAPVKECPECHEIVHAGYGRCPACQYEFPPPEDKQKHDSAATRAGIVTGQKEVTEYDVKRVDYHVHEKRNAPEGHPRTMRVEYEVGFNNWIRDYICVEHPADNFARQKAVRWWAERSNDPCPTSADDAVDLALQGSLAIPEQITVEREAGSKFTTVTSAVLGEVPPAVGELEPREVDDDAILEVIDEDDIPF